MELQMGLMPLQGLGPVDFRQLLPHVDRFAAGIDEEQIAPLAIGPEPARSWACNEEGQVGTMVGLLTQFMLNRLNNRCSP